uniref:SLH domain-containing protein n=1 Tax=uncultured Bacillota bacterium TaxID=344338 RepID=A0A650EP03_9FIRM|nr:hypothetical protein Firmicute1046_0240 [uncultured Firmicutes bacterium]
MKKWMRGLTLSLAIFVFAVSGVTVFARMTDAEPETGAETVQKLKAMGVWDESVTFSEQVTRGEFAVALAQLMNVEQRESGYAYRLFSDVDAESPYYTSVMYLNLQKVVAGEEDGVFEPERPISYYEAVKMCVCAMGYQPYAELNGGFPTGYLSAVAQYKLFPTGNTTGIGGQLSRAQALRMIEDMLDAPYLEQNEYGERENYYQQENVTILSVYHDIYLAEGILMGAGARGLTGGTALRKNQIQVGDNIYTADGSVDSALLGYRVSCYYYLSADGTETVKYLEQDTTRGRELKIDGSLVQGFDGRELVYYRSEDAKTTSRINVGQSGYLLYNGNYAETYEESDFKDAEEISFIDADNDGIYETVSVYNEQIVVVSGVSRDNRLIYDKYSSDVIDLSQNDDERSVVILDAEGNAADFSVISEWTVLSAAQDKRQENVTVRISDGAVTGVLEKIKLSAEITQTQYTIDGQVFCLSKSAKNIGILTGLSVGTRGEFLLDCWGRIAAIRNVLSDTYMLGYMVDAAWTEGLTDTTTICLYSVSTQNLEQYQAAPKVKLNDQSGMSSKQVFQALKGESGKESPRQLVRYMLDSENRIKEIILGKRVDEMGLLKESTDFIRYNDYKDLYYNKEMREFPGELRLADDSVIVHVPEDEKCNRDLTRYGVSATKDLGSGSYTIETYDVSPDRTVGALVIKSNSGRGVPLQTNSAVTVVRDIVTVADADGIQRKMIKGWRNGADVELILSEECPITQTYTAGDGGTVTSTIEQGDLIRVGTNSDDEVEEWYKVFSMYDRDDASVVTRNPNDYSGSKVTMIQYHNNAETSEDILSGRVWEGNNQYWFTGVAYSVEFGIVQEKAGDTVIVETTGGPLPGNSTVCKRMLNLWGKSIYVLDAVNHEVRRGSVNDIIAAEHDSQQAASRVVYGRYNDVPSFLVVVKR